MISLTVNTYDESFPRVSVRKRKVIALFVSINSNNVLVLILLYLPMNHDRLIFGIICGRISSIFTL